VLSAQIGSRSSPKELFSSEQYFPFYLFWSPNSQQVTFLSNAEGAGGLALHAVAADGSGSRLVETGQPFYWDWSPLVDEIFIHTGGSAAFNPEARLAYLAMDKPALSEEADLRPGAFQAPAWSPDGKLIALIVENDGRDSLITLERESGEQHTIAASVGLTAFSWSPDGSSLAYAAPASDGIQRDLFLVHMDRPEENRLLSTGLITAFFWSPDSRQIAIFEPTLSRPGEDVSFKAQEAATIRLALEVLEVETGESHHLVTFAPSDSFLNLLPFFDQYQRSIQLWSPDSRIIVLATEDERDPAGIFTVDTLSGSFSRIASGDLAFWSWK